MEELEIQINVAVNTPYIKLKLLTVDEMIAIKNFISKCSISDFEKLKELDYDLSTAKTESDDTAK